MARRNGLAASGYGVVAEPESATAIPAPGPDGLLRVADAETGEVLTLNNRTGFNAYMDLEADAVKSRREQRKDDTEGKEKRRRDNALRRKLKAMGPLTSLSYPKSLAIDHESAAEIQIYRMRLDEQIEEAIAREEKREVLRQQLLRDENFKWRRMVMKKAFRRERREAEDSIKNLRFDNEMSLAYKLAEMGLLK